MQNMTKMQQPVRPRFEMPSPIIDATSVEVLHRSLNALVPENREHVEGHERKMEQYRKDMTEYKRQNA